MTNPEPIPVDHSKAIEKKIGYGKLGLVIGALMILGGVVLFFGGISGNVKLLASYAGLTVEMSNAAPGAVLFIIGLIIVLITVPGVTHTRKGAGSFSSAQEKIKYQKVDDRTTPF